MPILSHPAFGPRASLIYITVGAITDIIVGCWWGFMVDNSKPFEENRVVYFILTTFGLIGLVLLVIGVLLGRIGQSARRAELPPPEALPAEAAVQQTAGAAGVPPAGYAGVVPGAPVAPVAPAAPIMPGAVPSGTVGTR